MTAPPPLEITSFAAFARVLAAAVRLDPGLPSEARRAALSSAARASVSAPVATAMARAAEDIARHFTHPGPARDDAIALFFLVAPAAFADPAAFDDALSDPARTAARMIEAIRAGALARDFDATVLAEPLFRAVSIRMLASLQACG